MQIKCSIEGIDLFNQQRDIKDLLLKMTQFSSINSDKLRHSFMESLHLYVYQKGERVLLQGEGISNTIYIIKRGTFSLTHVSKYIKDVYFTLDYVKNYQEEQKDSDRFISFRNYELKGNFSYLDNEKICLLGRGEIIGDIEWMMKKDVSLFNIISNENNSEILTCDRESFENFTKKIPQKTNRIIEAKIHNFLNRIKQLIEEKKMCTANPMKLSFENNLKKQIEFNHLKIKQRLQLNTIHNRKLKLVKLNKTIIASSAQKPSSNSSNTITINNNRTSSLTSTILRSTCESSKLDCSFNCLSEKKDRTKKTMVSEFKLNVVELKKNTTAKKKGLNRSAININQRNEKFPLINKLDNSMFLQHKGKLVLNVKKSHMLSHNEEIEDNTKSLTERKTHRRKISNPVLLGKNLFLNQKIDMLLKDKYNFLRHNSSEKTIEV